MTIKLAVTKREQSAAALRAAGMVPAIVYGPKQTPLQIAVNKQIFEKTVREAGESTIVELSGVGDPIEVLIHDVAFDAGRGGIMHADFYAIERGKELTTDVPLHFVGEAPIEKSGATVSKVLHEVEVTCRPSVLPSHLEVDLSGLDTVTAQIHVRDLAAPTGVTIETDPDAVVAMVSAARSAEPETAAAETATPTASDDKTAKTAA